MTYTKVLIFLLTLTSSIAYAKAPTIPLNCAHISGYKIEAERVYLSAESGGGDTYMVYVTFIEKRPSKKLIDTALRACLDTAIKLDGSKDMVGASWYRKAAGNNPNDDELLSPYGSSKDIFYSAVKKKVEVRVPILTKK